MNHKFWRYLHSSQTQQPRCCAAMLNLYVNKLNNAWKKCNLNFQRCSHTFHEYSKHFSCLSHFILSNTLVHTMSLVGYRFEEKYGCPVWIPYHHVSRNFLYCQQRTAMFRIDMIIPCPWFYVIYLLCHLSSILSLVQVRHLRRTLIFSRFHLRRRCALQ